MGKKVAAVIVAHPDDETLWAGGTILDNPTWEWYIICLCRAKDGDRSARFLNALRMLNCSGIMGDLDDGPDQVPLSDEVVEKTILDLLPSMHFDLVLTHNPAGEYTRHRRHEETGRAVIKLWKRGKILTDELWVFAYNDDNRKKYPEAVDNASIRKHLSRETWLQKYGIITRIYGFKKGGFEADTTPKAESFWQFTNADIAVRWSDCLQHQKT